MKITENDIRNMVMESVKMILGEEMESKPAGILAYQPHCISWKSRADYNVMLLPDGSYKATYDEGKMHDQDRGNFKMFRDVSDIPPRIKPLSNSAFHAVCQWWAEYGMTDVPALEMGL